MPPSPQDSETSSARDLRKAIDALADLAAAGDWSETVIAELREAFNRGAAKLSPAARRPGLLPEGPRAGIEIDPGDARIFWVVIDPWPTSGGERRCVTCGQKLP